MLMRVNMRCHLPFIFSICRPYLCCLQQAPVVIIILHRCCHLVVYNRSCSVPLTVPVHLYELGGAGTLSANNKIYIFAKNAQAQERRSLVSQGTLTTELHQALHLDDFFFSCVFWLVIFRLRFRLLFSIFTL